MKRWMNVSRTIHNEQKSQNAASQLAKRRVAYQSRRLQEPVNVNAEIGSGIND